MISRLQSAHHAVKSSLSCWTMCKVSARYVSQCERAPLIPDDRMIMNPGRARNELVPNGLARIVPWKRNQDRATEVGMVSDLPMRRERN
jgi:hypothetical protein